MISMKNNLLCHGKYYGSVEVDTDDNILYGKILHINDLVSYHGETVPELKENFLAAVDNYLETCSELGVEPDKPYKGSFNIRISPELHREVAITASINGTTLNDLTSKALEQYVDGHVDIHHYHTVEHKAEESSKTFDFSDYTQFTNRLTTAPSEKALAYNYQFKGIPSLWKTQR